MMPTVLIYWSGGRTTEQKAAVVQGITDTLVTEGKARREDVTIIFQNIEPGDAARGGVPARLPALHEASEPSNGERESPVGGMD